MDQPAQIINEPVPLPVAVSPQPPSPVLPKKQVRFLPLMLLVILVVGIVGAAAFWLGKSSSESNLAQPSPTLVPTIAQPTPTLTPTISSDFTVGWKTYLLKALNLEFKLPPVFDSFGGLTEQITPGEKGTSLCMTFSRKTSFFVKPVLAGAAACVINYFGVGTTSADFEAGRMAGFTDLQGYVIKNEKYFAKLLGKEFEIPLSLVTQMGGPGGLSMLKIMGKDTTGGEFQGPMAGTPGKGEIGALINTGNNNYPGLAVEMELAGNLTEDLFNQILSTFKFLN